MDVMVSRTDRRLTVWLSKVWMIRSAASRLWKTTSAITRGCVLTRRQLSITPPMGVMALSISAAVVPGAKFWAMTA